MTNKEAIESLTYIKTHQIDPEDYEVFDLAIKALEQSDCKQYHSPYFEIKIDKEQLQELVDKAKAEVLASIERPQGEWIEKHSDYGVYYQCSICHKMPPNYECDYKEGAIKTNFCPNCGADMRKGGAE